MLVQTSVTETVYHNGQFLPAPSKSIIKPGFKFSVTHCDGYVAFETVETVTGDSKQFLYVCESGASYYESDFKRLSDGIEVIN